MSSAASNTPDSVSDLLQNDDAPSEMRKRIEGYGRDDEAEAEAEAEADDDAEAESTEAPSLAAGDTADADDTPNADDTPHKPARRRGRKLPRTLPNSDGEYDTKLVVHFNSHGGWLYRRKARLLIEEAADVYTNQYARELSRLMGGIIINGLQRVPGADGEPMCVSGSLLGATYHINFGYDNGAGIMRPMNCILAEISKVLGELVKSIATLGSAPSIELSRKDVLTIVR